MDYNLELRYREPFLKVWEEDKDDEILGPLSERMGVSDRDTRRLLMTEEESEAAGKCRMLNVVLRWCQLTSGNYRFLPRILLHKSVNGSRNCKTHQRIDEIFPLAYSVYGQITTMYDL